MAVRDRLRRYAAQYLAPGEEIQVGFYAKRPGAGYNDCVVVATDRRLLLLGLNFFGPAQGLVSEAPRRTRLGPCSGRTHSIDAFGTSLTVDRRFFKDVAEADRAAEGMTTAAPTRCVECGSESTGATAACARCGAPVRLQQPMAAAPAAGWYGSPVPPSAQGTSSYWAPGQPYYPYWPPGQPPPPGHPRRKVLIGGGVGLGVLVALIVVIAVATSSPSATSGKPTDSAPSAPPTPTATELTWDQLRPGDCLAGSHMGLGDATAWPETVTQVACTRPHEGEVFFAADNWPQSMKYPGQTTIDNQVSDRCTSAFAAYDGTTVELSAFSFASIADDDSADWASGSRRLVCVAYMPSSSGPSGGTPVNYSIRHSDK